MSFSPNNINHIYRTVSNGVLPLPQNSPSNEQQPDSIKQEAQEDPSTIRVNESPSALVQPESTTTAVNSRQLLASPASTETHEQPRLKLRFINPKFHHNEESSANNTPNYAGPSASDPSSSVEPTQEAYEDQNSNEAGINFLPPITLPANIQSHANYFKELKNSKPTRSKEFYKIGPMFKRTCQNFALLDPDGQQLYAVISARFDRGFKNLNSDWLAYRRNYFTLSSAFSLIYKDESTFGQVPSFAVYSQDKRRVLSFAIRITALRICSDGDMEELPLVQHTAKRDKGPREAPPIMPAVPGLLPDHNFMRNNTHYRSSARLQKIEPYFFRDKQNLGDFVKYYPDGDKVAQVVLHDRVQFTTAGGGGGSQICKAVVQLIATLDDNQSYVLAWSETDPFILRNRSPGNYYDDGTLISRVKKDEEEEEENEERNRQTHLLNRARELSEQFQSEYREIDELSEDEEDLLSDEQESSSINDQKRRRTGTFGPPIEDRRKKRAITPGKIIMQTFNSKGDTKS